MKTRGLFTFQFLLLGFNTENVEFGGGTVEGSELLTAQSFPGDGAEERVALDVAHASAS